MQNEFEWINSLLSKAGALAKGVGDDAFVFGKHLISADMSVEGTHFRLDWSTPEQAVEKCLLSNFSDMNAMGGKAEAILFSICMNKKWSKKIMEEIANAVAKICKKHKVKILGGDTTDGDTGVFSVAVFGRAKHKILLRSAAKAGDDVWVSGIPGRSGKGLELLRRGGKFNAQEQEFVALHKVPKPPLTLGAQIAKIKGIGACMDLSDSLAESLQHISKQSKVQIKLEKKVALKGGEDYELLFTARKSAREKIMRLAKKFSLHRIGIALLLISCEPSRLEITEVFDNNAPKAAYEISPSGEKEVWYSWYRNGIKAEEMPFKNGVPHGAYRKWSITGFVVESGAYKDSLREGKWTVFSAERVPYMQGLYKKGQKQGKWTVFNESGKIAGEQFYRNDSAAGIWKKFHNNVLIEENSCHVANETGSFRSYSNEGKALIYQECRYGRPNGVFMSYYPGGSLHKVGHFESGFRNGLWTEYFANGKLRKIERWLYSMRNGEWVKFGENGETLAKAKFTDGSGVFEDTSWQGNRIHGEVRKILKDGHYLRIETYENGTKQSTVDYPKDSLKPVALGFWKNDKKDGAWRTWYRNGVLRDSLNFKDGEPFGEHFHYDSTGRLYKKEVSQGRGHNIVEMF